MSLMALLGAPVPLGLMTWFSVVVSPAFGGMFADFGAELPLATKLAVAPSWGPAMLVAYVAAMAAVPFLFRRTVARDYALVAVVLGGLLAVMASAACLYLPLFRTGHHLS